MSKRKVTVSVKYNYEIEIDDDSSIVKEYDSDKELLDDLASYRFTTLPVINNGVSIEDITLIDWQIFKQ